MARIVFAYPDFESLGVGYLMSCARAKGHHVDFVYYSAKDAYLGRKIARVPYEGIAEKIRGYSPDIAAFSCVTDNYRDQLEVARSVKRLQSGITTIFGGVHPTAVPERVLRNDCVDAVAIGEAEVSFMEFLDACSPASGAALPGRAVPGIMFKRNGRVVGYPVEGALADLNELPLPHKKPFNEALKDSVHEYRLIASRGCPYQCSYCFNSHMHQLRGKRIIRRRSVSSVISELQSAGEELPLKYVMFLDDSFTTDKSWLREFCDRYRSEIKVPFACIANPQYINEEISEVLARAGCINIQLGIQSLSRQVCEQILDRRNDNMLIADAIRSLRKNRIMVQVDHMLGIPGDTREIQEESLRFYNTHRPDLISIFWLTYYPKTRILNTAVEEGVISAKENEMIEEGRGLTGESYLTGGSMKNPKPYYAISFLMNWLPLLPRWVVSLLIGSRLYRLFAIRNFFLSTALPRVVQSVFNKNDFRGRSHIIRFLGKISPKS